MHLPSEIYGLVFTFLPAHQAARTGRVSKQLKALLSEAYFAEAIEKEFQQQRFFKFFSAKLEYAMIYIYSKPGSQCCGLVLKPGHDLADRHNLESIEKGMALCRACLSDNVTVKTVVLSRFCLTTTELKKIAAFKYGKYFVPEVQAYLVKQFGPNELAKREAAFKVKEVKQLKTTVAKRWEPKVYKALLGNKKLVEKDDKVPQSQQHHSYTTKDNQYYLPFELVKKMLKTNALRNFAAPPTTPKILEEANKYNDKYTVNETLRNIYVARLKEWKEEQKASGAQASKLDVDEFLQSCLPPLAYRLVNKNEKYTLSLTNEQLTRIIEREKQLTALLEPLGVNVAEIPMYTKVRQFLKDEIEYIDKHKHSAEKIAMFVLRQLKSTKCLLNGSATNMSAEVSYSAEFASTLMSAARNLSASDAKMRQQLVTAISDTIRKHSPSLMHQLVLDQCYNFDAKVLHHKDMSDVDEDDPEEAEYVGDDDNDDEDESMKSKKKKPKAKAKKPATNKKSQPKKRGRNTNKGSDTEEDDNEEQNDEEDDEGSDYEEEEIKPKRKSRASKSKAPAPKKPKTSK